MQELRLLILFSVLLCTDYTGINLPFTIAHALEDSNPKLPRESS